LRNDSKRPQPAVRLKRDLGRRLESGKEADFTILESDPYKVSPDEIAGIKVSETWVAHTRENPQDNRGVRDR
jgi:predicted amidohydrolase YtcJ